MLTLLFCFVLFLNTTDLPNFLTLCPSLWSLISLSPGSPSASLITHSWFHFCASKHLYHLNEAISQASNSEFLLQCLSFMLLCFLQIQWHQMLPLHVSVCQIKLFPPSLSSWSLRCLLMDILLRDKIMTHSTN